MTTPPAIAGSASAAWFARVPYQTTWPRNSRRSVLPSSATQPAAVGPPRTAAAITGAVDTATWTPSDNRTGAADATNAINVQKPTPATISARLTGGSPSSEIAI